MYVDPKQSTRLNYSELYKTNPDLVRSLCKEALNERLVRVVFKKVNGEIRDMMCTTSSEHIPQTPVVEGQTPKKPRKENNEICKVFDVNKQEWRSFRYDHIINFDQPDDNVLALNDQMKVALSQCGGLTEVINKLKE